MIDIASQIWITIFGATALWLVKYNRYEFERTRDRVAAHLAKARSHGGAK